ncbi:MAG: iron chelate uptake ABC transporter family permease subunit [Pseudomonadota bacterium]
MPARRLAVLGLAALAVSAAYMLVAARAPWSFLLPFRGEKLAALILVAVAVSTATVLFQTITQNRILTPAIMGFDALYVLLLTIAVFLLGGQSVVRLPAQAVFLTTAAALIGAALLLFGTLLLHARGDLLRMVLTGIIFGVLFRSLTGFLQRLIDPNEFSVIQVASYARFNDLETDLVLIAGFVTAGAVAVAWRRRAMWDVLALGWDVAVNLGARPRRGQIEALVLIALLVSVSTALVGPVAFLGLLVVSLAHVIVPSPHHAVLLPAAALVGVIVLVGGQTVLERLMGLETPLSVIVDLLGGAVFLLLILRQVRR